MSRHRFQRGMRLTFNGREQIVEERLPNGDFRLKDIALNESQPIPESTLVEALFNGQLVFLGDERAALTQRRAMELLVEDLNMLSDDDPRKKEAKRRWAYVEAILRGNLSSANASSLIPLIERVHSETRDFKKVPNWRRVYYGWFKSFIEADNDPRVLVPQYKKRGNTKRKFAGMRKAKGQKFSEREKALASEVAEVVNDVINEEYLSPQRLSVRGVCDRVSAGSIWD